MAVRKVALQMTGAGHADENGVTFNAIASPDDGKAEQTTFSLSVEDALSLGLELTRLAENVKEKVQAEQDETLGRYEDPGAL